MDRLQLNVITVVGLFQADETPRLTHPGREPPLDPVRLAERVEVRRRGPVGG
jgi:hypothetical protein